MSCLLGEMHQRIPGVGTPLTWVFP